jgi:hypothetical protein
MEVQLQRCTRVHVVVDVDVQYTCTRTVRVQYPRRIVRCSHPSTTDLLLCRSDFTVQYVYFTLLYCNTLSLLVFCVLSFSLSRLLCHRNLELCGHDEQFILSRKFDYGLDPSSLERIRLAKQQVTGDTVFACRGR